MTSPGAPDQNPSQSHEQWARVHCRPEEEMLRLGFFPRETWPPEVDRHAAENG